MEKNNVFICELFKRGVCFSHRNCHEDNNTKNEKHFCCTKQHLFCYHGDSCTLPDCPFLHSWDNGFHVTCLKCSEHCSFGDKCKFRQHPDRNCIIPYNRTQYNNNNLFHRSKNSLLLLDNEKKEDSFISVRMNKIQKKCVNILDDEEIVIQKEKEESDHEFIEWFEKTIQDFIEKLKNNLDLIWTRDIKVV